MSSTTGTRLTLKFNFPQEIRFCGWSESYDLGYATITIAVQNQSQIASFLYDRCQCLGIGPIMVEAVLAGYVQPFPVGSPPPRRATYSFPVPQAPAPGNAYNETFSGNANLYDADYGTTVMLLNAQTTLASVPIYRRSIWIAGLPDISDLTASLQLVDPVTQQAVTRFINDLQGKGGNRGAQNGVSIRSVDRSAGNPVIPCTGWIAGPPVSFTCPGHPFVVGQPVQAEGCTSQPGTPAPRGRYLVSAKPDANTIQLAGVSTVGLPIHTGGFRASLLTFNPIDTVTFEGMTKRNKGRPFGLSRGRRPTVRTKRA